MPQVEAFITSLAPQPRRALRQAFKQLSASRTAGLDVRALEGVLQGYMHLRVQTYRVIYKVDADANGPVLILVAAGPRSTVYETFEQTLVEKFRA